MLKSVNRPDFSLELEAKSNRYWPCAGVDEAGRGPLAGPVVASAVILNPNNIPPGLDDSKRLNAAKREMLFQQIAATALAISVASSCAEEIDGTDIRKATLNAMSRAVGGLSLAPGMVLVDGRDVPDALPCPAQALIRGDGRSQSIAAASIIAKVLRDRMMVCAGRTHSAYGFHAHAGYGTAAHRATIASRGGIPRLHRYSFAPLKG